MTAVTQVAAVGDAVSFVSLRGSLARDNNIEEKLILAPAPHGFVVSSCRKIF
jgi:hypothetical protein